MGGFSTYESRYLGSIGGFHPPGMKATASTGPEGGHPGARGQVQLAAANRGLLQNSDGPFFYINSLRQKQPYKTTDIRFHARFHRGTHICIFDAEHQD